MRGSGRFGPRRGAGRGASERLNPLHCGAVVASKVRLVWGYPFEMFQSPSLRGSGRFTSRVGRATASSIRFQSPSLRGSGRFIPVPEWWTWDDVKFQSPSLRGSGRFTAARGRTGRASTCFNPLHCGAVVASCGPLVRPPKKPARVSIPFIAGQWSLLGAVIAVGAIAVSFQSPSLRGSGRFRPQKPHGSTSSRCFNPLHCGAVVASCACRSPGRLGSCLNPLHCGAVVASPPKADGGRRGGNPVSIPFIAGQWSLRTRLSTVLLPGCLVSIPFIAGQWSLARPAPAPSSAPTSFNPLHCGAVVAFGG